MCEQNNISTFVGSNARVLRKLNRIIAILRLVVVGFLAFNSTANYHIHRLPTGELVAHAHPFSKSTNPDSPYPSHKHTQFEFYYFSHISLLFGVGLLLLGSFEISKKSKYQPFAQRIVFYSTPEQVTNKAPPVI